MKAISKPKSAALAPLGACIVAIENPRAGLPPESVDELAANIAEYGVLQPVLGYFDADGRFAVCDGRRRLAALRAIPMGDDFTVPIREIPQKSAVGSALSVEHTHVALGIVEEVQAFARMLTDGKDIAAIARAFGVTERFVNGRVKLAALHEPILEALRTGEISLDVAQIYATAHMARQEKVWAALGKTRQRQAHAVKEELNRNTLRAGDALAKFVGAASYVEAGGVIEEDFFIAPDMSRWLNPEIAERLAQDKLRAIGDAEGAGFAFTETGIDVHDWDFADGNFAKPRKPTPEEKARLAAIKQRRKALQKAHDALYATDENELNGDQFDAAEKLLDDENDALDAEERRIFAAANVIPDDAKGKCGVIVTIDADGAPLIRRGVVKPKEKKAAGGGQPAAGKGNGKAASVKPSRPEPQAPMTNLTHEKCSRIASIIIGRSLANNPHVALAALVACAARQLFFSSGRGGEALKVSGFDEGEDLVGLLYSNDEAGDLLSDKQACASYDKWKLAVGKSEAKLEETLAAWKDADLIALLAFCVGASVSVVETNAARVYSKLEPRGVLMTLGKLAGAAPAKHFIPQASFLEGLSRDALAEAATELKLDTAGAKTKGALAAMIADKAKAAGWVPPLLRTLCGCGVSAAARTAATKEGVKAAAKAQAKPKAKKAKVAPKKVFKKIAKQAPKPVKAAKVAKKSAVEPRP